MYVSELVRKRLQRCKTECYFIFKLLIFLTKYFFDLSNFRTQFPFTIDGSFHLDQRSLNFLNPIIISLTLFLLSLSLSLSLSLLLPWATIQRIPHSYLTARLRQCGQGHQAIRGRSFLPSLLTISHGRQSYKIKFVLKRLKKS